MTALVRYEVAEAVATLTLDSPNNRNALSAQLMDEFEEALAEAGKDPEVRAVVLAHTGRVFCSGMDLSEATGSDPAAGPRRLVGLMRGIVELAKPVVGVTTGHVRAGGLGLLGACDLALAGPESTFAFTEVRLGLAPTVISLPLLPRIDPRAAGRWYLTGEKFGAAEAARIGLVTLAFEGGAEEALAPLLDAFRAASPQGLSETKRLVTAGVRQVFERDAEDFAAQSARLFASEEAREGMRAFLERRAPRWAR
ncbi:enoyl-CoA hydratase family protein [Phaeacidiphilus oryzae]|uniref:enoyl-CoA hydratase family protein n=1 Tax=Phaeacidiphilus oryzae TaxID=348818 RepID=UPI00068C3743|nr:enoyl-CoA hydratase family protein [Phaeacidiphilus oryzae]